MIFVQMLNKHQLTAYWSIRNEKMAFMFLWDFFVYECCRKLLDFLSYIADINIIQIKTMLSLFLSFVLYN